MSVSTSVADPVTMEIVNEVTNHVMRELTTSIMRSGYSTIIKESMDVSVALHDSNAQLIAQSFVQPVQLGVIESQIRSVMIRYDKSEIKEGDSFVLNHPYEECQNHATDVTLVTPIFYKGELVCWVGNTAHKPDFGGRVPGTNAGDATDTIQEGLLLPPVKLYRNYTELNRDVYEIIRANTRTPELTLGDIRAQVSANFIAEQKVRELFDKYGKDVVLACWNRWMEVCEQYLREKIRTVFPDGEWEASDYIDDDGIDLEKSFRVSVVLKKQKDELHMKFDSDEQAMGPINLRPCMVSVAANFCTKAALAPDLPNNAGFQRPVKITLPRVGSLLNPKYLGPVNMYPITSVRIAGIILRAMAQALPKLVPASSGGYINGMAITGLDPRTGKNFVQYEIHAGGSGARYNKDGISSLDADVTNTMNTPVEAVESEFPVLIERYELVNGTGGAGRFRGGLAIRRDFRILCDLVTYNIRSDRNKFKTPGIFGGYPGSTAVVIINPGTPKEKKLTSKAARVLLRKDDVISLRTCGGPGNGDPTKRDPELVLEDVLNEYVSLESALNDYKVVINKSRKTVDYANTKMLRLS